MWFYIIQRNLVRMACFSKIYYHPVRTQVFTSQSARHVVNAICRKGVVFVVICSNTACVLNVIYNYIRGHMFRELIAQMIEAVSTWGTVLIFYQTILCNISKDRYLHTHRRENLKCHVNIIRLCQFIIPSLDPCSVSFGLCFTVQCFFSCYVHVYTCTGCEFLLIKFVNLISRSSFLCSSPLVSCDSVGYTFNIHVIF